MKARGTSWFGDSLHNCVANARWSVDEECRSGSRARIVLMGSTAKSSAQPLTNIAIAQPVSISRSSSCSFFLLRACIWAPCLGCTCSVRTLCNCQFVLRKRSTSGLGNRARVPQRPCEKQRFAFLLHAELSILVEKQQEFKLLGGPPSRWPDPLPRQ